MTVATVKSKYTRASAPISRGQDELTYEILRRAAALVLTGGHSRGAYARDHLDKPIDPLSMDAVKFSIEGAILRARAAIANEFRTLQFDGPCEEVHDAVCEHLGTQRLSLWNDLAVSPKHVAGVLSSVAARFAPVVVQTPTDARKRP